MKKTKEMPEITEAVTTAFWKKVAITANPDSCWNWTGAKKEQGYGIMSINHSIYKAHRISYFLNSGIRPDALFVCHSCDNPLCVNPNHLFLGTHTENMSDMVAKGRADISGKAKGEKCGRSKLTETQVLEIRKLYSTGVEQSEICRQFSIAQASVSLIVNRINWKHI